LSEPWRNYRQSSTTPRWYGKKRSWWQFGYDHKPFPKCVRCGGEWFSNLEVRPERWYWTKIRTFVSRRLHVDTECKDRMYAKCARCGKHLFIPNGSPVMLVTYTPDKDA
jgi:hypothetical protein